MLAISGVVSSSSFPTLVGSRTSYSSSLAHKRLQEPEESETEQARWHCSEPLSLFASSSPPSTCSPCRRRSTTGSCTRRGGSSGTRLGSRHFWNPLCPYSRDSWPPLKKAVAHYGPRERDYGAQTLNKSRASIVKDIHRFASRVAHYSDIKAGFNNRQTDLKTRVSFKYSASRGVYGTLTFFLNGFLVPDNGSHIDYHGWRNFIDPIVA